MTLWTLSKHWHCVESNDGRRIRKDLKYPCPSRSWWSYLVGVGDEFRWFPARSSVPLPSGYVAVSVSLGRGCPYLLPLSKAYFLNLSLDVGKRCEGVRAAAWEVRRTLRTPVCNLSSSDLCVSWHPLNVDLNVWSCLGDAIEVVDYPDSEVLFCCCNWEEGPSDGCTRA